MGWIVFCSNFLVLFVFTNIVFSLNWRPPKGVSLHCDHLERAELNMEFMVLDDILPWIDNHYMSQYTRFLSGPLQVGREHCSSLPTTSAVFQCANCTRWEWQGTRTCSTNESLDLLTWLSLSTYRVYLSPFSFSFSCHDVGYVDCLASSSAWEPRCWYLGDENLIRTGESSLSESIFIIPESHWHRRRIEAPFISNTVAPETKFNLEIVNQNLKSEANVENHKLEYKNWWKDWNILVKKS